MVNMDRGRRMTFALDAWLMKTRGYYCGRPNIRFFIDRVPVIN